MGAVSLSPHSNGTAVGAGMDGAINHTIETHLPQALQVAYYVLGIPISVLLIISNVILIAAIVRSGGSMATKLNMVVCNMAVCDVLLGVMLLVNTGTMSQHPEMAEKHPTGVCTLIGLVELLPVMTGFLFLSLIHLDRFLAVCVPTVYPDMWNTKRVAGLCAGAWIFGFLMCAVAYAFQSEENIVVCDILALPRSYLLLTCMIHVIPTTIINIVLILKIKHVLKVHQRKIQVTNTLTYTNLVDDTQLAKLYFILVVMSFVAWTPFIICVVLWFSDLALGGIPVAVRATFLLGHLAGIKLVVYVCESHMYRSAVKKLFSKTKREGSNHNIRGSSGVQ